jgi:hypothetical protein
VDLLATHMDPNEDRDYMTWNNTINVYTTKSLTVATDKLPALAGIAQVFGHPDDIYLAGMWLNDWMGGLFWQPVSEPLTAPPGMKEPRAPSWSWASLDGPVIFAYSSPDYDYCERLRAGQLYTDNEVDGGATTAAVEPPSQPSASLNSREPPTINTETDEEEKETELVVPTIGKFIEPRPYTPRREAPSDDGSSDSDDDQAGTVITIDPSAYRMDGRSEMLAKLLAVSHTESDFLGKVTDISLTLEGHAEWVVARANPDAELMPEHPSTLNGWVGTYDDFNGNWNYDFDRAETGPCRCLRLILCPTGRMCFALLLRKHADRVSYE